jgi:hypothetical protein
VPHLAPALDLQAVRPIILEAFGLQQLLQEGFDFNSFGHGRILPGPGDVA